MEKKRSRQRRTLGSYPFLSVVFSISLALLVIGLFGLLMIQTNRLTNLIQENVEFQVYLRKNTSEAETTRIQRIITTKPYVLRKENSPQLRFVSRDEAAKQFIADTGEDFSELLGENPLRDLFVLKVNASYQSLDSLAVVEKELAAIRGVFEVNYVESLVQSINQNLTKIGIVLSGIAVILLLVVIILINNTIKLALFSQRFLIRSMQLVGATSGFIKRPFLFRAWLYGAIGGLVACAILYALYQSALQRIPDLVQLYDLQSMLILAGAVLIIGMFVAYFSTYRAINRYLRVSLDDLY